MNELIKHSFVTVSPCGVLLRPPLEQGLLAIKVDINSYGALESQTLVRQDRFLVKVHPWYVFVKYLAFDKCKRMVILK